MRKNKSSVEALLAHLKKEFEFIGNEVEGILLYGSHAKGIANKRSDIDICLIKPEKRDALTRIFAKFGDKYDVKIFEDLPLHVKIGVIENYRAIHGNEPEISYYLYGFRKQWEDMRHRITSNKFRTLSEMITTRRKWLDARRKIPVKA
jgi:predicted nucleotidyltransferase